MQYEAGEHVVIRDIRGGIVHFAWPLTVVEDGERGLLVAQVPGAIGMVPRGYPDNPGVLFDELASGQPTLVELTWKHNLTLGVAVPDQWWGARLFWNSATGDFLGYYVDIARPIVRNGSCIDTLDLALDIVVTPDGSWRWKDEDHLPQLRTLGWIDDAVEEQMEIAKAAAVAAIGARRYPFDDSLLHLRPSVGAAPAVLPADWQTRPQRV